MGNPANLPTPSALEAAAPARLSPSGERHLWFKEAAWSLWSPLGVFGIALIPYIALVELSGSAWVWAQPLLKGFGLLMVIWFVTIAGVRLGVPGVARMRALRNTARELLHELSGLLRKHGNKISPEAKLQLQAQANALNLARQGHAVDALDTELKKLAGLMDRTLGSLRRQSWSDVAFGVVLWLGVALLVRAVLIEPYRIPSGSMIPTLEVGDQIFVNKFLYGVRIPFINKVPFVLVRAPKRGDVIVFNNPVDTSVDFIKRVVGIPGDTIELFHNRLKINGQFQDRKVLSDNQVVWDKSPSTGEWAEDDRACELQENLTGLYHRIHQRARPLDGVAGGALNCEDFQIEHQGPYSVPPGHVFVMGDNRDNSLDSRFALGATHGRTERVEYVPLGNIKGKAMIIWLSWSHGGLFSGLLGGGGLRTDRLFLPVH